ncbi:class I SAM-dependent methyltransferase [Oecophyllibacter saccharovorans]|uniref:class I SAM-dependent methyltransferase n=1 Tax=Oecophyllibacter saccharovorans TaxID=2558360 RepID=UPI001144DDAB|nr:class I SAM-dependent methyltransferase [Oecophyllibacter saccharovorans]QDH15327.1 class I SAM-dependent methyltransferase [Oecophyllibacter saccharovorans]
MTLKGLHEKAFTQASSEPDAQFFAQHNPETLLDLGARTAITALYRTSLPVGGRTLDLMCGPDSHLPEDATFQEFIGLDVCNKLMDENKALNGRAIVDLNAQPSLPFSENSFDGVLLCNGLPYLTQPEAVLKEVVRVLKPGAPLILTFNDRFFPAKATAIWQALEPADRVRLASALMNSAGLGELDTGEVTPPEDLPGWQDTVHAVIGRKPQAS